MMSLNIRRHGDEHQPGFGCIAWALVHWAWDGIDKSRRFVIANGRLITAGVLGPGLERKMIP